MSLQNLLLALSDGEFHSGDALGGASGVSRTAIWKQLKKVEELGLSLESIKGKGYRIVGGLDLLDKEVISGALSNPSLVSQLEVFSVIDSTNAQAMKLALGGNNKGYVCTAEQQTAGRGRRGRAWVSPYGGNIYLSVVWEFSGGASSLEGLSLAVGVAVVNALAKAGIEGAQLKWPNDVLFEGHKLAGVLLEMTGDAAGPCQVVIGVGLNVCMPKNIQGIDQAWTDVSNISDSPLGRNQLLALMLDEIMPMLERFERVGFIEYREAWEKLDAHKNREVSIRLGDQVVSGIAQGVDDSGAVIIKTAAGSRSFSGGEVSLRVNG